MRFEYQPLTSVGCFRLLHLEPAPDDICPIACRLEEHKMDTAPSYIALSYTWRDPIADGDEPEKSETIFVNNQQFTVRANLFHALRTLRGTQPYLWADAICINQLDTQERSVQVKLMRMIFSRAAKVWAWLGPEAHGSHLAMDFLSRLASSPDSNETVEWLCKTMVKEDSHPVWAALERLLMRKWFGRAWIVQEVALASDVLFVCGDRKIPITAWEKADALLFKHWSKLMAILRYYLSISATTFDPQRNILALRRRLLRGDKISVLASLQMTRYAQATDPRDYLFAKMGISDNELAELCPPNYNISPEESWSMFFEAYVQRKRDLYIICLAGTKPRQYPELPSWLPTWCSSQPAYPLRNFHDEQFPEWPHFDAARGTEPEASFVHGDRYLSCKGTVVDEIDGTMGDRWGSRYLSEGNQSVMDRNAYGSMDAAYKALCRTIYANTNRWGDPSRPPDEFGVLFATRCHELNPVMNEYEANPSEPPPESMRPNASVFHTSWRSMRSLKLGGIPIWDIVRAHGSTNNLTEMGEVELLAQHHPLWPAFEHSSGQIMLERRLFTTRMGYVGVGPTSVVPRDKVVILLGCKVPVILRQNDLFWELVGECYIDGIMYGEAFEDVSTNCPAATERYFNLV